MIRFFENDGLRLVALGLLMIAAPVVYQVFFGKEPMDLKSAQQQLRAAIADCERNHIEAVGYRLGCPGVDEERFLADRTE